MKARAYVLVGGRVQGVFFRSSTAYESKLRGVTGWVRNLPDGRVEAVFEGEKEAVEEILAFCHRGPEGARVLSLISRWEPYTGTFKDFDVL